MAEADIGGVSEGAVRALLGRTLRALRQKADLTQEMLAGRAGLTQNQVSDWETGKSWIELKSITSVLAGLGVSLAGFAAAMAEQAQKLAPDADWERWLEGTGPADRTDEVAEGPEPDSHVYIVIAAPADRITTFTGGPPRRLLGGALGRGRGTKPSA